MSEYLTEKRLVELIMKLIPNYDLVINKAIPNSGIKHRPDIRCEKSKIIIEFDGYKHYNDARTQNSDILKDYVYAKMDYTIVHIPYFIQASKNVVLRILHKLKLNVPENLDLILRDYQYPHGFIDEKAMLPVNFNEYGIELFHANLLDYLFVCDDVITSIEKKIEALGYNLCLPEKLEYLIKDQQFRKNVSVIKLCDPYYDLPPKERKTSEEVVKKVTKEIEKQRKQELRGKKLERILKEDKQ